MKLNDCVLIAFGFVMGGIVGAVVASDKPLGKMLLGTDGRLQWEILVTGAAAVLVAGLTVSKLSAQIRQAGELADDQRQRRARAARAMLPLALSEVDDYATACITGLYALLPCFQADGAPDRSQPCREAMAWKPPRVPENVLSVFKDCVEFSDDPAAEMIAELVRHLQVQSGRLRENLSRIRLDDGIHLVLRINIEDDLCDAAELYARAAALFTFARDGANRERSLDRADIYNALSVAGRFGDVGEMDKLADRWEEERQYRLPPPPLAE